MKIIKTQIKGLLVFKGEKFNDANKNGKWDDDEKFIDSKNGKYDLGEEFKDVKKIRLTKFTKHII